METDILSSISMKVPELVAALVLTPVLGLIGTKAKELLEARDVRQEAQRLMDEVTTLLAFTETLQKAATSGGTLAQVPAESLASLRAAIAERITTAVTHISPPSAVRIQERHLARDVFDRLFLLHRPLVWWAWPLHALYYGLLGMSVLVSMAVMADFQSNADDKWAGLIGSMFLFGIPLVIVNVLANVADRRKSKSMVAATRTDNVIPSVDGRT